MPAYQIQREPIQLEPIDARNGPEPGPTVTGDLPEADDRPQSGRPGDDIESAEHISISSTSDHESSSSRGRKRRGGSSAQRRLAKKANRATSKSIKEVSQSESSENDSSSDKDADVIAPKKVGSRTLVAKSKLPKKKPAYGDEDADEVSI